MSAPRKLLGLFDSSSRALSRVNFVRSDFFFTPDPNLLRPIQEYATGCLITPASRVVHSEHHFTVAKRYSTTSELIQRTLRITKDGEIFIYADGMKSTDDLSAYLVNANVRDLVNAILNDTPYVIANKFASGMRFPMSLERFKFADADTVVLEFPQHLESLNGSYYLTIDRKGEVWYMINSIDNGIEYVRSPNATHHPIIRRMHDAHIAPLCAQYHTKDICTDTSRLVIHRFQ